MWKSLLIGLLPAALSFGIVEQAISAGQQLRPSNDLACKAAEVATATYLSMPPKRAAFSVAPTRFLTSDHGSVLSFGWIDGSPDSDLLATFYSAPPASAFDCPAVIQRAAARGHHIVSEPTKEDPSVYYISAPVLSADSRHALVFVRLRTIGLGGFDQALLLTRAGHLWTISSVRPLSLS